MNFLFRKKCNELCITKSKNICTFLIGEKVTDKGLKLKFGENLSTNLGDQKAHQSRADKKCDRTALLRTTEQLLTGPTNME